MWSPFGPSLSTSGSANDLSESGKCKIIKATLFLSKYKTPFLRFGYIQAISQFQLEICFRLWTIDWWPRRSRPMPKSLAVKRRGTMSFVYTQKGNKCAECEGKRPPPDPTPDARRSPIPVDGHRRRSASRCVASELVMCSEIAFFLNFRRVVIASTSSTSADWPIFVVSGRRGVGWWAFALTISRSDFLYRRGVVTKNTVRLLLFENMAIVFRISFQSLQAERCQFPV